MMLLANRAGRMLATVWLITGLAGTIWAQEETTGPRIAVDPAATEAVANQPLDPLMFANGQPPTTATAQLRGVNAPAAILRSGENAVVATWTGGQLDSDELSKTLQMRKPRSMGDMPPQTFVNMPAPKQREVVRDLAYELILYQEAKKAGIDESTPEIAARIEPYRNQVLGRLYFQREIEPKLRQLDETAAREYYDQNKAELFTRPAYTLLQNLHLSALKPYTAKEGDTLSGLAEQFTGSAENTHLIRRGLPPYFNRAPEPEVRDKVPVSELKPGERLLVPLPDDEMTSKRAMATDLRQRLLDGASFEEIAREHSETGNVDPLTSFTLDSPGLNPIFLPKIESADTSFTEWIETPFGMDLFYIADRATTTVIPFEQVEDLLVTRASTDEEMSQRTIEQARNDAIQKLRDKYNLQINREVVTAKNPPALENAEETTVAVAANFSYNAAEFQRDLQMTGKQWQVLSPEERVEVVLNAPTVLTHLIQHAARDEALDKTDAFRENMESKVIMEVTSEYLRRQMQKVLSPSDADLRAYYERNLDRYTSPSQVTIRELSKRVNMTLPAERKAAAIEEAKKQLTDLRARLKTQQDFEQTARRESEAISTRSRGGLIGSVPENFRGESFRGQISDLEPGAVSEPFLYGSEVMIVRLDERTPPVVQPFEQVLRRVRQDYQREMPQKRLDESRDATLKAANFEVKF